MSKFNFIYREKFRRRQEGREKLTLYLTDKETDGVKEKAGGLFIEKCYDRTCEPNTMKYTHKRNQFKTRINKINIGSVRVHD